MYIQGNRDSYYLRHVSFSGANFTKNFARKAGGAIFADFYDRLAIGSGFVSEHLADVSSGTLTNAISSNALIDNAVGKEEGYGSHVASVTASFSIFIRFANGTEVNASALTTEGLHWKKGEPFPEVWLLLVDRFGQGPSLTRARVPTGYRNEETPRAEYNAIVKAIVESPDGFMPNALMTDVSSGRGRIFFGNPVINSGSYHLFFWVEEKEFHNLTLPVHVH